MKIITPRLALGLACLACACAVLAQAPTGTIAGVTRDGSGAAVAGAPVKLTSRTAGFARSAVSSDQGDFSFPALLAGEYEVSVEAAGFQQMVRIAQVEAGTTTTADFTLRVGDTKDSVTVDGASPQMHYDSNTVGGLVTQSQIQGLPLNGRSFLELAKLEPGVQAPFRATNNRAFVPVLGASGLSGFRLLGLAVVAADRQRECRDPAHMRGCTVGLVGSAIRGAAEGTHHRDYGKRVRWPSF